MAEQRLIDANALMESFRACLAEKFDSKKCVSAANCEACDRGCLWREVVSAAPTIDAVEVVRCKYCEHRLSPTGMCANPMAMGFDALEPTDFDFCSRGEPRSST